MNKYLANLAGTAAFLIALNINADEVRGASMGLAIAHNINFIDVYNDLRDEIDKQLEEG